MCGHVCTMKYTSAIWVLRINLSLDGRHVYQLSHPAGPSVRHLSFDSELGYIFICLNDNWGVRWQSRILTSEKKTVSCWKRVLDPLPSLPLIVLFRTSVHAWQSKLPMANIFAMSLSSSSSEVSLPDCDRSWELLKKLDRGKDRSGRGRIWMVSECSWLIVCPFLCESIHPCCISERVKLLYYLIFI